MMASEMLPIRRISFIVAFLACAVGIARWLPPAVRLDAAVEDLLTALEDADRSELEGLLSADYTDQWEQNRARAIDNALKASKQFWSLTITKTGYSVTPDGEFGATVCFTPTLGGEGTPAAPLIMERVNKLEEPFTLVWKREPWKPWSWKLAETRNPDLKSIDP